MARQASITGRWCIIEMETWDQAYVDEEVKAYIRFGTNEQGEFQFAYVSGNIDYRLTEREGLPAVEWSWEGTEASGGWDDVSGRGWAVLGDDGKLRGEILMHDGDDSSFVARRIRPRQRKGGAPAKRGRRHRGR